MVSGRERSRVVCVGAVRGVLVSGGRWVVDNESEVRLLGALRGERGALAQLRGLAAVLDEGLVEVRDLRWLNGRLSAIAALVLEEVRRFWGCVHGVVSISATFRSLGCGDTTRSSATTVSGAHGAVTGMGLSYGSWGCVEAV